MTDLDELRRALRAQESLAPDPVDVLAVATRRIRRRRTTSVAAVTLTVAALGAGAVVVLGRGTDDGAAGHARELPGRDPAGGRRRCPRPRRRSASRTSPGSC